MRELKIKFVENEKKATRFPLYENAAGLAGSLSSFYMPFGWFEARYDAARKRGGKWHVVAQFRERKEDHFGDDTFVRLEDTRED